MNAVERAKISHSDDVTSSSAFVNHRLRGEIGESSAFSEVVAMNEATGRIVQCGNEGFARRVGRSQ